LAGLILLYSREPILSLRAFSLVALDERRLSRTDGARLPIAPVRWRCFVSRKGVRGHTGAGASSKLAKASVSGEGVGERRRGGHAGEQSMQALLGLEPDA
jgi:hypothetical protein